MKARCRGCKVVTDFTDGMIATLDCPGCGGWDLELEPGAVITCPSCGAKAPVDFHSRCACGHTRMWRVGVESPPVGAELPAELPVQEAVAKPDAEKKPPIRTRKRRV
jgi:hypothetical protein